MKATRRDINATLAAALDAAEVCDFPRAQRFGEQLLRKLELSAVFKVGQVQIDDPLCPVLLQPCTETIKH